MTREILLIRHAPVETNGRLIGRSDWPAVTPTCPLSSDVSALVRSCDFRFRSPALRCEQTAEWLGGDWTPNELLWEQDFGAWQGRPYAELPDLGPLDRAALAAHAAPNGESFLQVCARYAAFLGELPQGRFVIVTHAGIIRAALGIALDAPEAGLAFAVEPLSLTRLTEVDGTWAINGVNRSLVETAA